MSGDDSQTGVTENAKRLKTDESAPPAPGENKETADSQSGGDPEAAGSGASNHCRFNSFSKKKSLRNRNYRKSGEDESSGAER